MLSTRILPDKGKKGCVCGPGEDQVRGDPDTRETALRIAGHAVTSFPDRTLIALANKGRNERNNVGQAPP